MDVAGALADRVGEQRVHEPDDGRLLGGPLELLQIDVVLVPYEFDALVAELREHLGVVGVAIVVALDRLRDRARRSDRDLHVVAGQELDLVDGHQVGGVGHGEGQRRADEARGDEMVLHHEGLRNDAEHLAGDVERERVDDGQTVLALEVGEELLLRRVAQPDEVGGECATLLALLLERMLELLRGQVAAAMEQVSESGAHDLGGRRDETVAAAPRRVNGVACAPRPAARSARAIAARGARRRVQSSKASAPCWRSSDVPSRVDRPARAARARKGVGSAA